VDANISVGVGEGVNVTEGTGDSVGVSVGVGKDADRAVTVSTTDVSTESAGARLGLGNTLRLHASSRNVKIIIKNNGRK
jgi:hypothetical protein